MLVEKDGKGSSLWLMVAVTWYSLSRCHISVQIGMEEIMNRKSRNVWFSFTRKKGGLTAVPSLTEKGAFYREGCVL